MTISFQDPPINEVFIGKVFAPQDALLIPYYGKLWELFQDEFPFCQHASPIIDMANQQSFVDGQELMLPRVWFISNDKTRLLQLQRDRFYCNWRQTKSVSPEPYERFGPIFSLYKKHISLLSSFFSSQLGTELETKRCDLSYVNILRRGKEWNDLTDLNAVFKEIRFPASIEKCSLVQGAVRLGYEMNDGAGKVEVSINQASNSAGDSLVRMELSANSSKLEQSAEAESAWFQKAHDAIVQGFCDLTTEYAQTKFWKRIS